VLVAKNVSLTEHKEAATFTKLSQAPDVFDRISWTNLHFLKDVISK